MFIKLTNAVEQFKGNTIYINTDQITAVYEMAKTDGGSLTTMIYGGPTGSNWEVEESMSQVIKMINNGHSFSDIPVRGADTLPTV